MIKRYGLVLFCIAATMFMVLSSAACTKKDTVSIPEQRLPVRLPELDEEDFYEDIDIEEVDTATPSEEQDLLNDEQK
jgi:hypothetical protein